MVVGGLLPSVIVMASVAYSFALSIIKQTYDKQATREFLVNFARVLPGRQKLDEQPIKSKQAEQSHEKCGQKPNKKESKHPKSAGQRKARISVEMPQRGGNVYRCYYYFYCEAFA